MGRHHFGSREIVDAHPYGMLDLKGILTHSSNIGMVTIAERMGNPALYEIVRRFGFGEKTGIDFPGESDGVVRPLRKWGRLTTQSVAIGYEISVTPLQLVTAFSAIANDGILLRPRLVHQLLGPDGLVVRENENPVVVGRAVPSNIARRMSHEFLASVVEDGSGKAAKLEGYRVLGKTGTAKLPFENRKGYETGAYMGAFMGAAPLRERGAPELAVVVMIRRPDPTLGYYGGAISAPVVGEILQHSLAYLEVPPDDESVASVSQP
jgi:cell division protein FtsI/penicillin-binding protein 2